MPNRFLESIRLVLDSARRGSFRVALIGAFALPFHGVRRATGDVDFLAEESGGDVLDRDLVAAGFRRLHRSQDTAHYAPPGRDRSAVDFVYARRSASLAMLGRALERPVASADWSVSVVDVEGIIGLKIQAIANDPKRRRRDLDDIVTLLERNLPDVDLVLLREGFRLVEMDDHFEAILAEIGADVTEKPALPSSPDQRELRPDESVRDLAEFLAFLDEFENVAGRDDRERRPITGASFRL